MLGGKNVLNPSALDLLRQKTKTRLLLDKRVFAQNCTIQSKLLFDPLKPFTDRWERHQSFVSIKPPRFVTDAACIIVQPDGKRDEKGING
jgi:hypothetical protein